MNEILLELRGLSVTRNDGGSPVRQVSFQLKRGTTLGIIGESGAGKTSLALALAGLHDRQECDVSGGILWKGRQLAGLTEAEWQRLRGGEIGMIFQDPQASLDSAMRVDRQVAAAVRLHAGAGKKEAMIRAIELLAEVGINGQMLRAAPYAFQLSGGLAQRVMIALALAGEPELLVCDEPTSSLDLTTQAGIISLLRQRQRRLCLTMIFISHDLALVTSIADQVLVMRDGEAVELADREVILTRPAHPYTTSLINAWREYQARREESNVPA